ncbi:Retrotransposable element Tf2 [Cucumis melo var. makuwa]|uniref:Retrotransposable element Tf2 n=1 Tax=Cucumis melo var. makuwa TaxID=1194695 RepID=A0A5D3DS24_CUCMM|nr:Retrotransposable element Tf2 [Cucumis melo var. makuwa]TYK26531.1 Retrotransposable element Tf2 [Cucumis melo var. makuwa]
MKQYADRKRRHVEYHAGDLVFLKIWPYRQLSLRRKRYEKLSPKYFGPYAILERVGTVAYKLDLPSNTSIHPVFHVSQLKKFLGDKAALQPTIQYVNENLEWQAQSEETLGYQKNKAGSWEVLIHWKELPEHEASWESYEEMHQLYPNFHLEDKVNLEGGSNVRPPVKQNYSPAASEALGVVFPWRRDDGVDPGGSGYLVVEALALLRLCGIIRFISSISGSLDTRFSSKNWAISVDRSCRSVTWVDLLDISLGVGWKELCTKARPQKLKSLPTV